jgi:hypothetical protein
MTPESKIACAIKRWVKAEGGLCRKCSWEGRRGAPDLFIMLNGRHCWLEIKTAVGELTALQKQEIAIMKQYGCHVAVVRSLEDAQRELRIPLC